MIVALDADILGNDPEDVRHIAGFAAGRRAAIDGKPMNRLWAVEAALLVDGRDGRPPRAPRRAG